MYIHAYLWRMQERWLSATAIIAITQLKKAPGGASSNSIWHTHAHTSGSTLRKDVGPGNQRQLVQMVDTEIGLIGCQVSPRKRQKENFISGRKGWRSSKIAFFDAMHACLQGRTHTHALTAEILSRWEWAKISELYPEESKAEEERGEETGKEMTGM